MKIDYAKIEEVNFNRSKALRGLEEHIKVADSIMPHLTEVLAYARKLRTLRDAVDSAGSHFISKKADAFIQRVGFMTSDIRDTEEAYQYMMEAEVEKS